MPRKKRNRSTDPQAVAPKTVWQGFGGDNQHTDTGGSQRASAARQANIADADWFATNPGREYRARPSIPLEKPTWDIDSHLAQPMMVVSRRPDKPDYFYRIAMNGNPQTVPDNERFLMLLWRHIATTSLANGVEISAAVHRDLLKMSGCLGELA